MSIDGTDFSILEPIPFDSKWYTHKFNGAGLRYKVGICIQTGWICWINGPFPCGAWPDIRISRDALVYELLAGEKLLSDRGYGGAYHTTPHGRRDDPIQKMQGKARARHETINGLFKKFNCLNNKWRHNRNNHHTAFWAVANITQLKIQKEGVTWHVPYNH